MKSFVISLVLFSLLTATIVLNYSYINKCAEFLIGTSEKLSFEAEDAGGIKELEKFWDKNRDIIGLSVSYREIDHFCETLISLRSYYESGNRSEFENSRAILIDAAEELARLERFSVGNIF